METSHPFSKHASLLVFRQWSLIAIDGVLHFEIAFATALFLRVPMLGWLFLLLLALLQKYRMGGDFCIFHDAHVQKVH